MGRRGSSGVDGAAAPSVSVAALVVVMRGCFAIGFEPRLRSGAHDTFPVTTGANGGGFCGLRAAGWLPPLLLLLLLPLVLVLVLVLRAVQPGGSFIPKHV